MKVIAEKTSEDTENPKVQSEHLYRETEPVANCLITEITDI